MNFSDLNLAPAIVDAVHELGYTEPTPVQEQAIPIVMQGHDLLAGAQTGTGKTAGFALPILQRLNEIPAQDPGHIRVLVLAPTRELAAQVEDSFKAYAKNLDLKSVVIFGGVGMNPQIDRLKKGCDILVATPGRLLDLNEQGHINLAHVEVLVLDEADRMLDMGFIHDVKKILKLLPRDKQSLLFSATFTDEIRQLANSLLKNPQSIQVTPSNTTVELIDQTIYPVGRKRKKEALLHLIVQGKYEQVLVFTRTKHGANQVAEYLSEFGLNAMALHGNKSQRARTAALDKFKSGELNALVATDIAARGIDIEDLPFVVNFDIPNVPEDYVHRIGRTGRAGSQGKAVSLVCMDEEGFMHQIERFTKQQIPVALLQEYGPEAGEKAEPIAMGRQVLWGGLGKSPAREVMQEAARAARREMMERNRRNKAARGQGNARKKAASANEAEAEAENHGGQSQQTPENRRPRANAKPQGLRNSRGRLRRNRQDDSGQADERGQNQPHVHKRRARKPVMEDANADFLPRNIDPLQTNLHGRRNRNADTHAGNGGQPDPLRTSIDTMGRRGKRNYRAKR